ncbi:hypothetical protein [Mesorhizobium caraganae]|uniref:hypothetical protein n=1 Tax=Mesorhizobium caraganae TaxID=483206 RepID=UPI001780095F|nr:hypothetical protein [Mesorhizobium caraganae]
MPCQLDHARAPTRALVGFGVSGSGFPGSKPDASWPIAIDSEAMPLSCGKIDVLHDQDERGGRLDEEP